MTLSKATELVGSMVEWWKRRKAEKLEIAEREMYVRILERSGACRKHGWDEQAFLKWQASRHTMCDNCGHPQYDHLLLAERCCAGNNTGNGGRCGCVWYIAPGKPCNCADPGTPVHGMGK